MIVELIKTFLAAQKCELLHDIHVVCNTFEKLEAEANLLIGAETTLGRLIRNAAPPAIIEEQKTLTVN